MSSELNLKCDALKMREYDVYPLERENLLTFGYTSVKL
jgi:hypothetical protein